MSWLNINGNWIGRHSGKSWSSYWTRQSEVLFFGLYSEIADGKMPNKKSGATDYLTVVGSVGSETYQCPNTAPYIAADTDYIWFKQDGTQRTTTTAELIGYDLQRTPVKYLDDAPNSIEAIIILSSAVTGAKRDRLFRDMHLPIMWDNSWNDYGREKSNRALEQVLWTPEVVFCDEYQAVYDAMSTKPSDADALIQNTMVKALVDEGIFAKIELFPMLGIDHDEPLNWENPGTFDPIPHAGTPPIFEAYAGHTGANDLARWFDLGYIPATHAVNINKDNICLMIGVGTDYAGDFWEVGVVNDAASLNLGIRPRLATNVAAYFCCDATGGAVACTNSIAHFAVSRNNSATKDTYINKAKTVISRASVGLPNKEMVLCGANYDGTKLGGKRQIRYMILSTYLTEAEVGKVIDIMEAYFDNYSKGLL